MTYTCDRDHHVERGNIKFHDQLYIEYRSCHKLEVPLNNFPEFLDIKDRRYRLVGIVNSIEPYVITKRSIGHHTAYMLKDDDSIMIHDLTPNKVHERRRNENINPHLYESESRAETNCTNVKSGSDIQLTALEGQLQKAEEKCNFIKKRLDYMKMLYQSAGPTGTDMTVQLSYTMSPRSTMVNSPRIPPISVIDEDFDNDKVNDPDNTDKIMQDDQIDKTSIYSPKFDKLASKTAMEISVEKSTENLIINEWSEKSFHQVYSSSTHKFFHSSSPEIIETLPRKPELVLKLTGRRERPGKISAREKPMKSRMVHSTHADKNDGNRRDDSPVRVMRIKKRKTKLKTSNSRSTTASKHVTVLPESKHIRRNKRRERDETYKKILKEDFVSPSHLEIFPKNKKPLKLILVHRVKETQQIGDNVHEKKQIIENNEEVVEIYHNRAIQSAQSFSETSSKQQLKITPEIQITNYSKEVKKSNNQSFFDVKKNQDSTNYRRNISEQNDREIFQRKREQLHEAKDDYEVPQSQPIRTWCNSLSLPNYQQPTCASKLKRVDRCYLTARFNLRNIPFVVGTSVTPSFNLGLNIQQTLSLMKTRQPALAPEMRPFFIKKVGEELNPLFSIQEAMNNGEMKVPDEWTNFPVTEKSEGNQQKIHSESIKNFNTKRQKEEPKQANSKFPMYNGMSSASPDIRNVFLRLHNKFEEMQEEYEKLQEQAAKSKDKALAKKLSELEEELEEKENEINAVVGLYNEVMALKSQINYIYNQKNSFLCIADNYSGKIPSRMNPTIINNYQRPKVSICGVKTPSTSTRLTGLLRQIQSFQQQLISS